RWHRAQLERIGGTDLYLLLIDNRPTELYLERTSGGAFVTLGRHTFDVEVRSWRSGTAVPRRARAAPTGIVPVRAPMTGTIIEVRFDSGAVISEGDVLLVVEAMKMNNEIKAPAGGEVAEVAVAAGDRVSAGDVLISIRAGELEAEDA
ncbi:MAG: acetyl-CoA carboxylase biotin carboxyl carrier protein subunit, partial [Dehalococcoidia bacterium]